MTSKAVTFNILFFFFCHLLCFFLRSNCKVFDKVKAAGYAFYASHIISISNDSFSSQPNFKKYFAGKYFPHQEKKYNNIASQMSEQSKAQLLFSLTPAFTFLWFFDDIVIHCDPRSDFPPSRRSSHRHWYVLQLTFYTPMRFRTMEIMRENLLMRQSWQIKGNSRWHSRWTAVIFWTFSTVIEITKLQMLHLCPKILDFQLNQE